MLVIFEELEVCAEDWDEDWDEESDEDDSSMISKDWNFRWEIYNLSYIKIVDKPTSMIWLQINLIVNEIKRQSNDYSYNQVCRDKQKYSMRQTCPIITSCQISFFMAWILTSY